MTKQLLLGLLMASLQLANADPVNRSNLSQLENDRDLMVGMKLRLPMSRQDGDMSLQFGAHYDLDGDYAFVPIMTFRSQDGWDSLALEGSETEGADGSGTSSLLLIGGGLLLVAAIAAGTWDSEEDVCETNDLFDLLECIDED